MVFHFSHKLILQRILVASLMLFVVGATEGFAGETKNPVYSNNPIAAEVDGEPIYLDDLKHVRIQEALTQLHEMQTRALKEKILDKLAEKPPVLKSWGVCKK